MHAGRCCGRVNGNYSVSAGAVEALARSPEFKSVDASAWFDGVTRGNARLLGLEAELGSLAPGKAGDLVVLDMQDFRAMSHPGAQWLERVLWNLKCGLIRWVVVDGEIVFRQTSQCPTPKDPLSSPTFARG